MVTNCETEIHIATTASGAVAMQNANRNDNGGKKTKHASQHTKFRGYNQPASEDAGDTGT